MEIFVPLGGGALGQGLWTVSRRLARVLAHAPRALQRRLTGQQPWRLKQILALPGLLLPDRLDISWITPSLAVGGAFEKAEIPRLALMGIRAIVDLRAEAADDEAALAAYGLQMLHLPVPDTYPPSTEQLDQGAGWVLAHLAQDHKVLVHCQHGSGRSIVLTCAVLIRLGYRVAEAVRLVRARRWQAGPTPLQLEAILAYDRRWRATPSPATDAEAASS